jgi:hypothetical protein
MASSSLRASAILSEISKARFIVGEDSREKFPTVSVPGHLRPADSLRRWRIDSQIIPLDDLRVQEWEGMIDINVKGVLYGIAAALSVFRR